MTDSQDLEVSLLIRKGFRHQIRAPLAWVGLPILGDSLYEGPPAPRLYLESRSFGFKGTEGDVGLSLDMP